ncbi:MAG: hypothetical protein Ctma_1179 [Catillopecten margaritatus gill symbiont]|uniref:Colicin V production protein n=1 Tax=Catillopecten margaritatus gill symbiont TaxID=3083288 RepID=A0AAU6PHN0_9GAMM
MSEFFANIGSFIAQIHWSAWVSTVIFIGFGVRGFARGMAKELIGLGFLILSFVVAWLLYSPLSIHTSITWMLLSAQSNMAIAFGVIFVVMQVAKMILYRIIAVASEITNPCILNKSFLVGFLLIATAVFNYYIDVIFNFNVVETVITAGFLHSSLSFAVIFFAAIGLFVTFFKLLNISISTSSPCLLGSFIQAILNILSALDDKLNATNIIGKNNQIFGSIVGLAKGFAFIIVMILILQSINIVSQEYYWVESESSLRVFQDVASNIKPELSKYLLFIKND